MELDFEAADGSTATSTPPGKHEAMPEARSTPASSARRRRPVSSSAGARPGTPHTAALRRLSSRNLSPSSFSSGSGAATPASTPRRAAGALAEVPVPQACAEQDALPAKRQRRARRVQPRVDYAESPRSGSDESASNGAEFEAFDAENVPTESPATGKAPQPKQSKPRARKPKGSAAKRRGRPKTMKQAMPVRKAFVPGICRGWVDVVCLTARVAGLQSPEVERLNAYFANVDSHALAFE